MLELMVQKTFNLLVNYFCSLRFIKLVSNCFFASIKRYIKEELTLINKQKKILHKKIFFVPTVSNFLKETGFFVIVLLDVVLLCNSPI